MRIGHASIDERGKISGGVAGDQTGREVFVRDWYDNGWNVMIRAKDPSVAERMAVACEKGCANDCIGYDQGQRNTLRAQAAAAGFDLSAIKSPCETDCSAFMAVCAEAAGVDMDATYSAGNAPTTRTMRNRFFQTGQFDVFVEKKYLTGTDWLQRGDILVKEGYHTVMALDNGAAYAPSVTPSAGRTNIEYCVKTKRHGWLPTVRNDEDYAGVRFNEIIGIAMRVDQGSIAYRVHDKHGWNNWITGFDLDDIKAGWAGNNEPIDMVEVYYHTPNSVRPYRYAVYRVSPMGSGYYDWQRDTETTGGQDGYAGAPGKMIDRFQIVIR